MVTLGPLAPSRKTLKKGIEFNMMVIGERGLGKSTMIRSMFNNDIDLKRDVRNEQDSVQINTHVLDLDEPGCKIKISIIDVRGYGDFVNNEKTIDPIEEYVDSQLMKYYTDETGLNRRNIVDNRVHCCLYLIEPSHRGLKPLDIKFMRVMQDKTNIFPILSKADSYTNDELISMKKQVLRDIHENQIKIYEFPICDEEDDPDFVKLNDEFKKLVPFSIICGTDKKQVGGKTLHGRSYEWGFIDMHESSSSDFPCLCTMLFRTHIHDLRDVTEEIHYENFRAKLITGGNVNTPGISQSSQ